MTTSIFLPPKSGGSGSGGGSTPAEAAQVVHWAPTGSAPHYDVSSSLATDLVLWVTPNGAPVGMITVNLPDGAPHGKSVTVLTDEDVDPLRIVTIKTPGTAQLNNGANNSDIVGTKSKTFISNGSNVWVETATELKISDLFDVDLDDSQNTGGMVLTWSAGENLWVGAPPASVSPLPHAATHGNAGSDRLTLTSAQISDLAAAITAGIASWVNTTPANLDTLSEIAAQLATDESAVASLVTTVATKMAKTSNLSDVADVPTARTNLLASPSLNPTAVKTAAYTVAANEFVPVDTTSGAVVITLPTAPANGSRVGVKHVIQGGTNSVTINTGGSDVYNKTGGANSATLPLSSQAIQLQYKTGIWYVVADDMPLSSLDLRFVKGNPQSGMANLTAVRLLGKLNHAGPPVAADGTFVGGQDAVIDSTGLLYTCTVSGTPGTWVCPSRAGQLLDSKSSTAADTITTTISDLSVPAVTFSKLPDRDIEVRALVPAIQCGTADNSLTVTMTDEANTASDHVLAWQKSGTASRNGVWASLLEIIPAGTGSVTRKLRGQITSGTGTGSVNATGISTTRLDVYVR